MAKDEIRLSQRFAVPRDRIYRAWLDSQEHTAFTGGSRAEVDARVGGRHTAWDGYVEGEILALDPGRRIVATWRADDFPEGAPPSRVEVILDEDPAGGTLMTLVHSELPEGESQRFGEGWLEYYLKPMADYFAGPGAEAPATTRPAATKARPAVGRATPAASKPATRKARPAARKPATRKAKPAARKPAAGKAKPATRKPGKPAARKASPAARKPAQGKAGKAAKKPSVRKASPARKGKKAGRR
jgi:uncharacterized protein YndB with AHSA1/START domain